MIVALKYISFRIKKTDAAKLQDEYARLVEGLQESAADASDEDTFMANPGSSRKQAASILLKFPGKFCQTTSSKKLFQETSERPSILWHF
jgi:hypothetical protein